MERERLRAEIARDKEARRANKGVLPRWVTSWKNRSYSNCRYKIMNRIAVIYNLFSFILFTSFFFIPIFARELWYIDWIWKYPEFQIHITLMIVPSFVPSITLIFSFELFYFVSVLGVDGYNPSAPQYDVADKEKRSGKKRRTFFPFPCFLIFMLLYYLRFK